MKSNGVFLNHPMSYSQISMINQTFFNWLKNQKLYNVRSYKCGGHELAKKQHIHPWSIRMKVPRCFMDLWTYQASSTCKYMIDVRHYLRCSCGTTNVSRICMVLNAYNTMYERTICSYFLKEKWPKDECRCEFTPTINFGKCREFHCTSVDFP